jgi:hypothetical protein
MKGHITLLDHDLWLCRRCEVRPALLLRQEPLPQSPFVPEPWLAGPFAAPPLDGGTQAKRQLASALPNKGRITLTDLAPFFACLGKEVRLLADLLHGLFGLFKQSH